MTKQITVTIDPKGNTTVETLGFKGEACLDATRLLEQALGVDHKAELTAEYYEKAPMEEVLVGNGN